jgi:hypothetical protein
VLYTYSKPSGSKSTYTYLYMRITKKIAITGMCVIASLLVAQVYISSYLAKAAHNIAPDHSVEIGITGLSPNGVSGGVAVPASGGSAILPIANLTVRVNSGVWISDNITIYSTDDLDLRWSSQFATACTGTAFTVTPAGAVNGFQPTVTAPAAGASITYTVTCTNGSGSASDSITVGARTMPAPQCSDGIDNSDTEDTYIDFDGGVSTVTGPTSCWIKGTGACSTVCSTALGTPNGGQCTSGEARSAESVDQLLGTSGWGGTTAFIYGCWADGSCRTGFLGAGTQTGGGQLWVSAPGGRGGSYQPAPYMCYAPGQQQDGDNGDISVGCKCNVPDVSFCTKPPAPVYGTPDPGCASPTDTDETDGPPTVTLEVKNDNTTMSWTGNNITVPAGNNVSLKWNSTNATACSGTAFSISPSSLTSGTQSNVTEPTVGNTTVYRVTCTGPDGSATDSLSVTAVDAVGQPPTITADPRVVRYGEKTKVSWNTGTADPAECSTSGNGWLYTQIANQTGTADATITAEAVFTLTCPLGTASVTVKVLPKIQES